MACGATLPSETHLLDPMILKRDPRGKVVVLEPRPVFRKATEDYQRGKYAEAIRQFMDVADEFPDSPFAPHALFNAGLANIRLERWAAGRVTLDRAVAAMKGTKDEWDARFQRALCLEKLKAWRPLKRESALLARRKGTHITLRVESLCRIGIAHYELEELAEAEQAFEEALEGYRQNMAVPTLKSSSYVARAQYLIGEIYRGLFITIKFRLPVETMQRALQDKSSFFLKGQSAYLRAIRLQNDRWSVAAGYKLGRLYEDMYRDMMTAEVPDELDEEDRKVYFEELKKYVHPLVVRAVEVYERNLGMSDRMGSANEWSKKTQASLDRMREILRREFDGPRR